MEGFSLYHGFGEGGAENLVCNLSDSLINNGCDVYIISLTGEQFVYPENDIKIISINMEKSFLGGVRGYFKARKIISELQPDVLHSHMYHANILARLLRLSLFIPRLICTAHSNNELGYMCMCVSARSPVMHITVVPPCLLHILRMYVCVYIYLWYVSVCTHCCRRILIPRTQRQRLLLNYISKI